MTNNDVITAWGRGKPAHTANLSTDGNRLYSYALCIGEWRNGEPHVFNYRASDGTDRFGRTVPSLGYRSMTTSHHVSAALRVGYLTNPEPEHSEQEQAGWLVASRHVVCGSCIGDVASSGAVKLFHINIDRYAQHCHSCGVTLHEPQTDAWPELFSTRDCSICTTKGTTEFRAETHDVVDASGGRTQVEVGIVSHNGQDFAALGSVITPLQVTAYKAGDNLTTWAGETIGTCRVTSSWPTPRSYMTNRMYQLEAVVNGVRYTGRCAGDGMIFNGRRVAGQ